jgi:hypothetical protein
MAMLGALAACLVLAGCVYDYTNHEDRVSYSAGDAVAANLIKETINPEYRAMYKKQGLGRNGIVVPQASTETAISAAATPSTPKSP